MKGRGRWFSDGARWMGEGGGPLLALATGLGGGLLFCGIFAAATGIAFTDIPVALWQGAWGDGEAAGVTLAKTSPLLLTGLAVTLAFRTGLLNIGCEGQLTLGALTAAAVALKLDGAPWPVTIPVSLVCGAAAGGIWTLPALWLKERRGVHEVVSTLLLNYVAVFLAEYLVLGPLGDGTAMGRTPELGPDATLGTFLSIGGVSVTAAPVLAVFLCLAAHVWLRQTVRGYEVRATGENRRAAERAGIDAKAWRFRMFVLSGALAGLGGSLEVLAVHHRFYRSFSPGYGFDGITAAFLVGAEPGWLPLSALVLASLRAADKWLQLELSISPNVITVLQAVVLLSVAVAAGVKGKVWGRIRAWRSKRRKAAAGTPPLEMPGTPDGRAS